MKKISNKKGFTLAELLIVVAIIAVLVAVAIPVFSSSLNKAKLAVDEANVRAKYAELVADAMADGTQTTTGTLEIDGAALEAVTTAANGGNGSSVSVVVGTPATATAAEKPGTIYIKFASLPAVSFNIDGDVTFTAGTTTGALT